MTTHPESQAATPRPSRRKLTYALVLMMVVLLTFVGLRLFARISEITVWGSTSYTAQELIDSSELQLGKRLYGVDEEEVAQKLLEKHPLLQSVRVDKKGFFGIILIVTEKQPVYYTEQNGSFYTLSQDLCVLSCIDTPPATDPALPKLLLPDAQPFVFGQKITFVNENPEYILKFTSELRNHSFYTHLTCLNVSDPYNLKAIYGEDLEIRFGNHQDLDKKCKKTEDWLVTVSPVLYRSFDVRDPSQSFASGKTD